MYTIVSWLHYRQLIRCNYICNITLSGKTGCEFSIGEGWVAQLVELGVKELEVQRSSSSKEKTNNITINVLTIFHSKRKKKGCEFYMHKLG
jgi:hypothetical protein